METLGPMYLSAVVKQAGHEARIVDIDNALQECLRWFPDIIGMSVMTGDKDKFLELNNNIRTTFKGIRVIVGGPDVTFFPQGYEWANVAVKGEGEQVIADLLQSGLKYPDIDSFSWPDRTDFPNMKVRDFIASRGCPNSCRYCFNDQWNKMFPELGKVRQRNVDDVIREIGSVNPEYVYFQDSCFGVSTKWLKEFSHEYKHFIGIPFQCHMRPNQITKERVNLLADCNCVAVRIALESASSRLRTMLGRGKMTNEVVRLAVELLQKQHIMVMLQNMIGLPDGDIEDDLATLEFNIRVKPTYAWVSIFQPYPGTEMAKFCETEGWYDGDYSHISDSFFDKSVLNFDEEYKEQLVVLQRIFALCVETGYMPAKKELELEKVPELVHKMMRKLGDKRLYKGFL